MTYAIENGGIETQATLELALVGLLNLCENTSVSTEIAALQSQASRMSALGEQLATTTDPALGSLTSSITMITAAPTAALTDMPSWATEEGTNTAWESLLSTAPWASYYYAHKSARRYLSHTLSYKQLTRVRICSIRKIHRDRRIDAEVNRIFDVCPTHQRELGRRPSYGISVGDINGIHSFVFHSQEVQTK